MIHYPQIDRDAQLREDWLFIDQLQSHISSQTLLWYDDKVLTFENQLKLFERDEIRQFISSGLIDFLENPIYLGQYQDQAYFARQIKQWDKDLEPYQTVNLRSAGLFVDSFHLGLLFYSQGLFNWHKTHRYCANCGQKTITTHAGHARHCLNISCSKQHFPRIEPAVIFAIINERQAESRLLLARQASWDVNRYSVLAGFVEAGESLENAVQREALEEVGLKVDDVNYIASQPWPFPSSLMLGFECKTSEQDYQLIDREIEQAVWVTAGELRSHILQGTIKLPFSVSISFHLIDRWYRAQSGSPLNSILEQTS